MSPILQLSEATRRVLLIDADPKRQKHLRQIITRVIGAPETRETLGALEGGAPYNLIVAHYEGLDAGDLQRLQEFSAAHSEPKVLLLSAGTMRAGLPNMFGTKSLTNLLATSGDDELDVDGLIVTCQKILRRDIFGLEKYFVWGVPTRTARINKSAEKDALLAQMQEYASQLGIPQRLANLFETVVDEFVTNALYNSPVDADGKYRYASTSRTQRIELEPDEVINLKVCCDARRLGVSISDPFGSLTRTTIIEYLAKCFRRGDGQVDNKAGGAGLGFYQILDALSHFVINIKPGSTTEMIGLIDISGTYKDFVTKGKSFNIFVVDG